MSSITPATTGYLSTSDALTNYGGTSGSSAAPSPVTMNGLSSGIDIHALINALMTQSAAPQTALKAQLTKTNTLLSTYQGLSADAVQLQNAADAMAMPANWAVHSATSSSAAVTATAGKGALGGTLTFTVDRLAAAESLISSTSVRATSAQVAPPATSLLVATGGAAVGLGAIAGDLALGKHSIAVTQASAAPSATGTALPAASTIGTGDQLAVSVDGTSYALALQGGTGLTPAQVADQVTAAAKAAGAPLGASVDGSGRLVLTGTAGQGSAHTLLVGSGGANAELGLTAQASAAAGTDAVVSVDGTSTTVSDLRSGATLQLQGPGGTTVTAQLTGGGLSAGTIKAAEISTGDGSLASLASAVTGAGVGISAAAVQTGPSAYRLQLTSTSTGSLSSIDLPPGAISGLGTLGTLTAGADAKLTVGTGPSAFSVTSSTNAVSGLMPGVTLSLTQTSATPVTVSVAQDPTAITGKVATLVDAANAMIKDLNSSIATPSSSSASSKTASGATTAGPLLGDSIAEGLLSAVQGAVSGATGASGASSAAAVGLSINDDGTVAFNQATFTAALTADPAATQGLFAQSGTSPAAGVAVYQGSDYTQGGRYDVAVTAAATQAAATGAALGAGATISGPETIAVTAAGGSFSFSAAAGQTLQQVADGLNTASTTARAGITASVVNGALQLQSAAYGSATRFSVTSTATGAGSTGIAGTSGSATVAGTDVAGTIGGKPATGAGQFLIGAMRTPQQGLLLKITSTPAQVAAGLSTTVTYSPGIAQRLANVAMAAVDPGRGTLTNAIAGTQGQVTSLTTQIAKWNPILAQQQAMLVQQYTAMETALAVLKDTQTTLFGSKSGSSSSGG